MKFTIIATATCKHKTANYEAKHGTESFTGETYVANLIKFDEVQKGKIAFAVVNDDRLPAIEAAESYTGAGYRTEANARTGLRRWAADSEKLSRW